MAFKSRLYINFPMLLRVIGWLLMIEAGFMLVPLIVGLLYGENETLAFIISLGVTAVSGGIMMSLRPKSREMGKREAILLTGMTWVILSLFGMLPFLLSKTHLNVTDAFFETMSGFTTTGASVLDSLVGVPKSVLFWRCVIQWIGGLGIILFTLAVVPMLNYQGGMQLFNAEVTGITHDKLRPRVSYTAKGLWLVENCLKVLLIVLLAFSEMDIFDAVCYGLSTMSTGGFATSDMSIGGNSLYVKIVVVVFMFLGGVNFTLIYRSVTVGGMHLWKNTVFKSYVCLIVACYFLLCLNLTVRGLVRSVADLTIDPLFQVVSIVSSTGLTEPDFPDWGPLAVVVLVVMMFVGASAGSTSGGAKIDRIVILFKFLKNEFYKMMNPNAVTTVCINGKGTSYVLVQKVLAFLFMYVVVVMAGGVMLTLFGMPLVDSFFCALSAVSNTGLGTEITGLSGNYSLVPAGAKWVLAFCMLVGRLELYTILLLFSPSFWRK